MIGDKITNKALDLQNKLAGEAQLKFIQKVMEWESVDFETAQAICLGKTDPKEPEYTLGFKMADPTYQIAMNMQRKKKRDQAIENFKKTLEPDELEIFERDVLTMNTTDMFKKALKRNKNAKK